MSGARSPAPQINRKVDKVVAVDQVYLDWEVAARRADDAQQEMSRLGKLGSAAPQELIEQLSSLENDVLGKLRALVNAALLHPATPRRWPIR